MKSITEKAQDTLAAISFLKSHTRWEIKIWELLQGGETETFGNEFI